MRSSADAEARGNGGVEQGARRVSRWIPPRNVFLLVLLLSYGCSPDFQESVGPTVPVPNLIGKITREGTSAPNLRVALEDSSETEFAGGRTSQEGWYEFAEVPAGSWTLRVDSAESTDFARLTYEFQLDDPEAGLVLPDLEIGLGGFEIDKPNPEAEERVPGFFSPLEFRWRGYGGEKQVRLYRASDGKAVWYSGTTTGDFIRWNGIGTEGEFQNRPVSPGQYRWRVRIDGEGTIRYYTAYRGLTLKE